MSSGKKCAEPGCTFYASSNSEYCSKHNPQAKEQMAKEAELEEAKEASLKEAKEIFNSIPPPEGREEYRRYLVIGASPDEYRRDRTHYNNPQVYLLDKEKPKGEGANYSRYIVADYSSEKAQELRTVAKAHAAYFDEMIFDYSTMCGIWYGDETLEHRFESFYIMLKDNGVLYLPECGSGNRDIEYALSNIGFTTYFIRLNDLKRTPLPHMLNLAKDLIILVAIKISGRGPRNQMGGRRRGGSRGSRSRGSRSRGTRSRGSRGNRGSGGSRGSRGSRGNRSTKIN